MTNELLSERVTNMTTASHVKDTKVSHPWQSLLCPNMNVGNICGKHEPQLPPPRCYSPRLLPYRHHLQSLTSPPCAVCNQLAEFPGCVVGILHQRAQPIQSQPFSRCACCSCLPGLPQLVSRTIQQLVVGAAVRSLVGFK